MQHPPHVSFSFFNRNETKRLGFFLTLYGFAPPQVVSCYLVMVVYYVYSLDRVKVYRYIGFAQQAYRELAHAQPVSCRLKLEREQAGLGLGFGLLSTNNVDGHPLVPRSM